MSHYRAQKRCPQQTGTPSGNCFPRCTRAGLREALRGHLRLSSAPGRRTQQNPNVRRIITQCGDPTSTVDVSLPVAGNLKIFGKINLGTQSVAIPFRKCDIGVHPQPLNLNPSTPQPLNPSTPQPLNPSTPQPLNPSTPQPLNPSTPQPLNPSTSQPLNRSTAQPLNRSTDPSTPQPLNPSPFNSPVWMVTQFGLWLICKGMAAVEVNNSGAVG